MNTIQLIGRLTRDPQPRSTGEGNPVAAMRLAVPRRDRDATPVYVDVTCFGKLAEACGQHLEKGRQVAVTGRLDHSEWETENGDKRSGHSVIANEVEFLARARHANGNGESDGS